MTHPSTAQSAFAAANLQQARDWIAQAPLLAVLTGAGVSAESGAPTFRDAQTGLWAQYRAEDMATEAGFRANPQLVSDWYQHRRERMSQVAPNAGHLALAQWAQRHPGRMALITQNVDGLHQRAGSPQVNCLHGDLTQDRWLVPERACCREALMPASATFAAAHAVRPVTCPTCGNMRRPAVVWFGEQLPEGAFEAAAQAASQCAVMLVVGTAGAVHPAAGLAGMARAHGAKVVVLNPNASEIDHEAHLCLRGTAAQCLPQLLGDAASLS